MRLTANQVAQYWEEGLVFIPNAFTAAEVEFLNEAYRRDIAHSGDHLITEDRRQQGAENAKIIRGVYASHQRQPELANLVRDPRLLAPVNQVLNTDVYVYQFKINAKAPLGGEPWAWHQDFAAWKIADQLPAPKQVNAVVFLDEVNEFNGPVIYVPGSHVNGLLSDSARSGEQRSKQHVDPYDIALGEEQMRALVRQRGMTSPKGAAGGVLFFHPEVVHGSTQNMSPFARTLLIVTYNDVSNLPLGMSRPEYVVCRDTAPLRPLEVPLLNSVEAR